jgi:polar amino acid transport system substrate-binding protein
MTSHLPRLALLLLLALALPGCASIHDDALRSSQAALAAKAPAAPTSSTTLSRAPRCSDPTASLRPGPRPAPGHMPAGTFMRAIQRRGRLIVGVDQNTLLLGYLNPFDGRIEGFEIDVARQVARAIFGDPNKIEFKAVSSAERIPALQDRSVDLVADALTINCERRTEVAFSSVYFNAGQRVLVPKNSKVRGLRDLAGKKVCATVGSTSIENVKRLSPRAIPYPVPLRTDCMVALQQGSVDAVSTDDAILFGFQAQDPNSRVVGPQVSSEPYGLGINKHHPDFVRFVNGVLAAMRADGSWTASYRKWLGRFGPPPPPPAPRYSR